MDRIIFIVEASVIGPMYINKAVKELGYKPIFLVNLKNQEGDSLKQILNSEFIECETTNVDSLINAIKKFQNSIAGIITFLDSRLKLVSEVAEYFSIPGIDSKVPLLYDKAKVSELIPEYSPKSVRFFCNDIPYKKIEKLFDNAASGIVVKPCLLAGGKGFREIKKREEIKSIKEVDNTLPKYLDPEYMIAQEYIDGELISYEGYINSEEIVFLGITGRKKNRHDRVYFYLPI